MAAKVYDNFGVKVRRRLRTGMSENGTPMLDELEKEGFFKKLGS